MYILYIIYISIDISRCNMHAVVLGDHQTNTEMMNILDIKLTWLAKYKPNYN